MKILGTNWSGKFVDGRSISGASQTLKTSSITRWESVKHGRVKVKILRIAVEKDIIIQPSSLMLFLEFHKRRCEIENLESSIMKLKLTGTDCGEIRKRANQNKMLSLSGKAVTLLRFCMGRKERINMERDDNTRNPRRV